MVRSRRQNPHIHRPQLCNSAARSQQLSHASLHLPLTHALVTGVGDIKGTITVSYASMLDGALKKAAADKAGECARTLSHYNTFFNCLYACYDLGS